MFERFNKGLLNWLGLPDLRLVRLELGCRDQLLNVKELVRSEPLVTALKQCRDYREMEQLLNANSPGTVRAGAHEVASRLDLLERLQFNDSITCSRILSIANSDPLAMRFLRSAVTVRQHKLPLWRYRSPENNERALLFSFRGNPLVDLALGPVFEGDDLLLPYFRKLTVRALAPGESCLLGGEDQELEELIRKLASDSGPFALAVRSLLSAEFELWTSERLAEKHAKLLSSERFRRWIRGGESPNLALLWQSWRLARIANETRAQRSVAPFFQTFEGDLRNYARMRGFD